MTIKLTSGELITACTVLSVNDTQVVCSTQLFPVGRNYLHVNVDGKGRCLNQVGDQTDKFGLHKTTYYSIISFLTGKTRFVNIGNSFVNPALITSVSPETGSLEGGTELVIEGIVTNYIF